jgi:hypothetical protein
MDILSQCAPRADVFVINKLEVGGPDRPPSQRMVEQMRTDEAERKAAERPGAGRSTSGNSQDEGYWAYMQRQVTERTERLNVMGDSMDKLEEQSSTWADDVSKYVGNQKKKAVMGCKYEFLSYRQ